MSVKEGQHEASRFNKISDFNYTGTKQQRTAKAIKMLPQGRVSRLVKYLAPNDAVTTAQIAMACSIGNVSDAAIKANEVLERFNLQIINYAPNPRPLNKFGEHTLMHVWELIDKGAECR